MKLAHREILIKREPFYLLPLRAAFRPLQKQLVLSDVHLGKASHFRKKGLQMPAESHLRDIDRMHFLLDQLKPETVLLLGDLFHSEYNNEWLWFKSLLRSYPHVQFVLVEGNHDILPRGTYKIENLLKIGRLEEQHFIFSHHPIDFPGKLNICGHVHPGIRIVGKARQSVTLPCFLLNDSHLILPAFGDLTGLSMPERSKDTRYFAVTEDNVVEV
jgi:DNA ligase-associated metallophosphoesterase